MSLSRSSSRFWREDDGSSRSQESILLPRIDFQSHYDLQNRMSRGHFSPPRSPPTTNNTDFTSKDNPYTPPEPTSSPQNPGLQFLQTLKQSISPWYPELLSLTFSLLTLLTTITILLLANNSPLPTWPVSISPNAVISALLVASKSSLIFVTARCMGQLKWNHFAQRPHSIHDFCIFDEASKGPLGAVTLVWKAKGVSPVAVVGAVVVVAAVLVETFGQQVLGFPSVEVEDGDAAARLPVTQCLRGQEGWFWDYAMMSGFQRVLLAAIFKGDAIPGFECGSGVCSWGVSSTLGFCGKCVDVTGGSEGGCEGEKALECGFTTPSGVRMGGSVEVGGPMPLVNTSTIDGVYDTSPGFYNFSTLVVAEGTNWTARLTECEIDWCAWVWENATSQGTKLGLHNAKQFPLEFTGTWDYTDAAQNLDDTQKVYTATGDYPGELNNTFTISEGKEYFLKYAVRLMLKAGYQGADFYTQLTLATSSLDYTDTESMTRNLAAFMTNALRTQDGMQTMGTAWRSVTFIHVRWLWLLLPAMEVCATGMLLCLTMIQSSRRQTVLWKSSLLAFVFCFARGLWTSDRDIEVSSLRSMERASRQMEVRLERDVGGRVRLVPA